jgi:hypothetical protein
MKITRKSPYDKEDLLRDQLSSTSSSKPTTNASASSSSVSDPKRLGDIASYQALPKEATTNVQIDSLTSWAKKLDTNLIASSGSKIFKDMRFVLTGIGDSSMDR